MTPLLALLRRELLARVRTLSHFGLRFGYAAAILLIIVLVAQDTLFADLDQPLSRAPETGQWLFQAISFLQFGLVLVLVPLMSAGAIVEERDERSMQLLLLTGLTHLQIAAGKFLARLGAILLLLVSNIPALFFAAFLGGVEPSDVVHVFTITTGTACFFLGFSLMCSAWARTTTQAAVVSYSVLMLLFLSLFGLHWLDMSHFINWHPVIAVGTALLEPLNLGDAW